VWLYELANRRLTRLTFQRFRNRPFVWTPDGKQVTYASTQGGPFNLFSKSADGSGTEQQLLVAEYNQIPTSWSPDGEVLAFTETHPTTGEDILLLELGGERQVRPYLRTPSDESEASFSPNGRWVAYTSDETGRHEVYVQPFPGPGGKWQISTEGGAEPLWAPNGQELFYRNGEKMMAVAVETETGFTADKARVLFEGRYVSRGPLGLPQYCISSDSQRFLMIQEEEQMAPTQLHAVVNWFDELERLAPEE
jgi:Tol biopolymer transport system component